MIEGIFEVHSDLIYNYGYCTIEGSLPKINSLVNYTETIKWLNDNSYCNFNSWVFVAAGDTITILYTLDGVYNFKHSVKKKRLITNYYKNLKELNKILD
jgi:hypothetical protein